LKSSYKPIGDYIRLVDERNIGLKITILLGLSITKEFIPSVANTIGSDMENYKIIRKNQFACSLMQVRRDKKIPVALLHEFDEAIISQAYPIFEVIDERILLPEYLMMWFSRSEFDRESCFYAVGGVRGSLEWEDFCNMQLSVPTVEKQKEIVEEYNIIVDRIKLNEQLNQKLEETARVIYKQWFMDFEFPDENRKPYKSSGGEMKFNNMLGNKIPREWRDGNVSDIANFTSKRINLKELNTLNYISTENMLPNRGGITESNSLPNTKNVTLFRKGEILISNIRPYFKKIWCATLDGGCSNDILCFVPQKEISPIYLYYVLEQDVFFDYVMMGSKGTKMPRGDKDWIMNYQTVIPDRETTKLFNKTITGIENVRSTKKNDTESLLKFSKLLLSKMTKE